MKKNVLAALVLVVSLAFVLVGCGSKKEQPKEPLNLDGVWTQTNGSESSYQQATIEGDTITIYWVSNGGDDKALYWAGSYDAPDTSEDKYSWLSVNDEIKTSTALLASMDKEKEFNYENGELSYQTSALGTTKTVRMERA